MLKKFCGCLLALLLVIPTFFAQNSSSPVYQLDWKIEAPLATSGATLSLLGLALSETIHPNTLQEVNNLSQNQWLRMDKAATDNFSNAADHASDWLLKGSAAMPVLLMADPDIRQEASKIGVLLSESLLITNGLNTVTKRLMLRNRPYVYNPNVLAEQRTSIDARLSFFSGHTAATSCLSFFSAKVWSDYHPESRWKPVVWTAAAAVPAVTGYLRYKAGKHYFTDVAAGYAVGALIGYFVPHLHKVDTRSRQKLRFSSGMIEDSPVMVVKYRF